jgi:hypothetical protein
MVVTQLISHDLRETTLNVSKHHSNTRISRGYALSLTNAIEFLVHRAEMDAN